MSGGGVSSVPGSSLGHNTITKLRSHDALARHESLGPRRNGTELKVDLTRTKKVSGRREPLTEMKSCTHYCKDLALACNSSVCPRIFRLANSKIPLMEKKVQ